MEMNSYFQRGANLGSRGGLMGLEMPFDQMVQSQQPQQQPMPQQQQAMGQPPMPPQAPQQAPQPPQQGMGQPTALGQPQAPQTPPQNQPAQKPQQGGKYNGEIIYEGKSMTVKDGITTDKQGNQYIVSNDGSIVTDAKDRRIVGHIENGEFIPITEEYMKELEKHGAVEK